ncbi:MAG TPA: hypothetical protein DEQ14_07835 [Treponema sp.]|nr:hypothetical protein [Treponema sp.]
MNKKSGSTFLVLVTAAGLIFSNCGKSPDTWYVQPEFARAWTRIIDDETAPKKFKEIVVWEGETLPDGPGILISADPWNKQEKVSVYYRLSYDLEYQNARVLAIDPWMIFRKHTNPGLPAGRVYAGESGEGVVLIPGTDQKSQDAWIARLIQERPGVFPSGETLWEEMRQKLFEERRFPAGAVTYNWQDVFFRLMGNEIAWVYAPCSAIRGYQNSRKAILAAAAFPEKTETNQYSLQTRILWALPFSDGLNKKENEKLAAVMEWLKKPETQTLIANAIEWIPADPYGSPYDPMSLAAHRNWLTATYIYDIAE